MLSSPFLGVLTLKNSKYAEQSIKTEKYENSRYHMYLLSYGLPP